jgi:hypothetical protein
MRSQHTLQHPVLAARVQLRLDANVLKATQSREGAAATTLLRTVDVTEPLEAVDAGVARRLLARVLWRTRELGFVEVAIGPGVLEPSVLADAIAAALAWPILGCFLQETVYPGL